MTRFAVSLTIGIVFVLSCAACERQNPPPKPIGSATNKHVEETPASAARTDADAMIQKMKSPMEDARQTEDVLKGAADRRQQQVDPTTP